MTATIHLDELIGEVVTVRSRNLVTRPTGVAVRDRVVFRLRDQRGDAWLDFSRVGVVDFSCADEVVAKLLTLLEELPVSRVALIGLHAHHAEAIDHALDRQGLTILALRADEGPPCLLGQVCDDLRDAFGALKRLGRATPDRVAATLAWSVDRAALALNDLARRRCALAHDDASYELGALR